MIRCLHDLLHLVIREREHRARLDFRRLHFFGRIVFDPPLRNAEREERAQPFEVLRGVDRAVVPALTELSDSRSVPALQRRSSVRFRPALVTAFESAA
jgi:hypothetical protein